MAAVLVMARAPVAGACKTRLEPLLGPDGCARLQSALIARTARWAQAAAPAAAFICFTPAAQRALIEPLVPAGMRSFAQREVGHLGERLAAAVEHVTALAPGPLLIVGSDMTTLSPLHASAAFGDLADGCDVTIGPATDGGYYLLGLRRPRPELFLSIAAERWGGPDVLRLTLAAAQAAGLRVGMLRAERDLDDAEDARALLADPITPDDVRAAFEVPEAVECSR